MPPEPSETALDLAVLDGTPSESTEASGARTRRSRDVSRVRAFALLFHRWVGLVMAAFLIVAGTTGVVLAFFHDLDAALNPELYVVTPPTPDAPLLDAVELAERVGRAFPEKPLDGVILEVEPGKTVNYWINDRETFVNPYTAEIVGTREFGDVTEGKKTFLTFIYRLHYSLSLGDVGAYIFGVIALLWTIDCFVGAFLTFPQSRSRGQKGAKRSWLRRWGPAWLLKTGKMFSLIFTWHRASGLWVWGMLFVFAWSGVALNLSEFVYEPVMNTVFPSSRPEHPVPHLAEPRPIPRLAFDVARARGRELMASESAQRGFTVSSEKWLFYDPEHGAYSYTVDSSLDIDERLADTTVHFDGDDGRLLDFSAPTGIDARTTVDSWLIALHFGAWREGGYVYRAFVAACGLLVTLLSVSGVVIWWRKRGKRWRRKIGVTA